MKWLLCVLLLVLVACAAPPIKDPKTVLPSKVQYVPSYFGSIVRTIDIEAGVVCYTGEGIFCLPISQTKLDK